MSEITNDKAVQSRLDFISSNLAGAVPKEFRTKFVNDWVQKFENDGYDKVEAFIKFDEYLNDMASWHQEPEAWQSTEHYQSLVRQPEDEKASYIKEHLEYLDRHDIMLPENRLPFLIDFLYASEKIHQPWARYSIDGEIISEGVRESCNFANSRKRGIGGSTARQSYENGFFGGPSELFRTIQGHALFSEMAFNKELMLSFFRGHSNEPSAEKKYQLQTGITRDVELTKKIEQWHEDGASKRFPWLRGNPDFIGYDPKGELVLADFKSSADPKKSKSSVENIPDDYYDQLAYYCLILERELGLKVDRIQLVNYNAKTTYVEIGDVEISEQYKDELLMKCDKFWNEHIVTNTPPSNKKLTVKPMLYKDLSNPIKNMLKKGHKLKQVGKELVNEGDALLKQAREEMIESGVNLFANKKTVIDGGASVISIRETKKDDLEALKEVAVRALVENRKFSELEASNLVSNSNIAFLKEKAFEAFHEVDGLSREDAKDAVSSLVVSSSTASLTIDKYSVEGQNILSEVQSITNQMKHDINLEFEVAEVESEMENALGVNRDGGKNYSDSKFYRNLNIEDNQEKAPF